MIQTVIETSIRLLNGVCKTGQMKELCICTVCIHDALGVLIVQHDDDNGNRAGDYLWNVLMTLEQEQSLHRKNVRALAAIKEACVSRKVALTAMSERKQDQAKLVHVARVQHKVACGLIEIVRDFLEACVAQQHRPTPDGTHKRSVSTRHIYQILARRPQQVQGRIKSE